MKRINAAKDLKVGDTLYAGTFESAIISISKGRLTNDRGESCTLEQLDELMRQGNVRALRWD